MTDICETLDNVMPIRHHMHQRSEDAALVGQEGKPESYYFPLQMNNVDNSFAHTFMGLSPGTTRKPVRRCSENWTPATTAFSICPAPTEFGLEYCMRPVHVARKSLSGEATCLACFSRWWRDAFFGNCWSMTCHPASITISIAAGAGWVDHRVVYGRFDGQQLFSARQLTLSPGARLDNRGASSWITIQGSGRIGNLHLHAPVVIHFGEDTDDEVFITADATIQEVEVDNTSAEPLVSLRYFGPDVFDEDLRNVGDHRRAESTT